MNEQQGYEPIEEIYDPADQVDRQLGVADWILGALTLPLLLWVLMFMTTGNQHMLDTPRQRMKLYAVLLAIELVVAALAVAWLV